MDLSIGPLLAYCDGRSKDMVLWKRRLGASIVAAIWPLLMARGEEARIVFTHALPALDGGHLETKIVEVTYAPGEGSPPHSHPCAVIGYVLEGAVRMQVKGEPEAIYKRGQSFYEAPNGIHAVSANASKTAPARFIAYFTCDRETPLTVAVP
jgi:quercetin dioxygenase-like cupin family protein